MIVKQRSVAEAVTAKRQAARVRIPQRESEGAETPRHAGISPALVHASDQYGIRYLRKLRWRKPERVAQFLSIVEPGKRREQRPSVLAGRSLGVAGAAGGRPQHEQRTVKATRHRASAA